MRSREITATRNNPPTQFSLRSLLAIVSLTAVTLAAMRWLGEYVIPLLLAGVGVLAFTARNARHFFVWLLPSLWSLCAFGSWYHPGDEHMMVCGSVLISMWIPVFFEVGSMDETHFFALLTAFGASTIAILGFFLDRLPVSRRLCVSFYIITSIFLLGCFTQPGSIWYGYCAANLSMYLTVTLCLIGGTILGLCRRFDENKAGNPSKEEK